MTFWNYENTRAVHVELSNQCNAACPNCSRYVGHSEIVNPELDLTSISLEQFKTWFPLDFVQRSARWVFCGTAGDPMMAKDVYEILEYVATNSKAAIQVNSNAGMRQPAFWKKLGKLFLGHQFRTMIFSVDGLEDTNHIYRRNVQWDRVISNMKAYASTGAKSQWDFIVFGHNEHQLEEARSLAKEIGIHFFAPKKPFGFEHPHGYTHMPVFDKNFNHLYNITPPSKEWQNIKMEHFFEPHIVRIDPAKIKARSKEEIAESWNSKIKKANFTFPDNLKTKTVTCKSKNNNQHMEIYVSATGTVLPCCYIGTWYGGLNDTTSALQLKNLVQQYGKEKVNLNFNLLKDILNSDYLETTFYERWNSEKGDGRVRYCFETCGGDSPIDKLYNKDTHYMTGKSLMLNHLQIKFKNITLDWTIGTDPVSQKWAKAVKETLAMYPPDKLHYSNFYKYNKSTYYTNMTKAMHAIRENIADMPPIVNLEKVDKQYLNVLHNWFAKNEHTHSLLADMHHNLHALEGDMMHQIPAIQVGWEKGPRIPFEISEYENFTNTSTFGDIVLTYHHIGKDPIAIYRSEDVLSDDVFVPWTHYAADFRMWFGTTVTYPEETEFWKWFDSNYEWFKERTGWSKRDPRIVTGAYVTARLNTITTAEELVNLITPDSAILEMSID